jgi:hypothetical protein
MWSQRRTEAVLRVLALAGLAAMLAGCSDIYWDRRETIALGANDHIATNSAEQMVDPWPRYVGKTNIAFDGERVQAGVERYRRHEVIQPVPLTNDTSTEQHPPPGLTTEHVTIPQPAPAPALPGAKQ